MVSDNSNLTINERRKIKKALPISIFRSERTRPIHYYKRSDGVYQIWYGDIITGNYVSQHAELDVCIYRMREYIDRYLNKDEVYMNGLAIRTNECPHCHKQLGRKISDRVWYICPECGLCYQQFSLWMKIQYRLWRWWLKKIIGGR